MQIVVVEGYAVNPGDLSWEPIAGFGELIVHDRTLPHQIVERCRHADIILSNKLPFDKDTITSLPSLRLINVLATGYNIVDVKAAAENGVAVTNVPGYGTASVAQHTIALLLALTNHVAEHALSVAQGEWQVAPDWCYAKTLLSELRDKTMGIVGFGRIGEHVARIANAFEMKVLYYSPTKKETKVARYCGLDELLHESDVITLHCPLTAANAGFINRENISRMKPSAFLLNTARGQLINEKDLADALNTGVIAGAALDVLSVEPPTAGNPLLTAKNCIITPHNAWMSREARQRIIDITHNNIAAFLSDEPVNLVNQPVSKNQPETNR